MNPIIEQLWNGTLAPYQACGNCDPEIEDLIELIQRNKNALFQILSAEQKDCFEKYIDCSEEYTYLLSAHAFQYGFCLALKFSAAAFSS